MIVYALKLYRAGWSNLSILAAIVYKFSVSRATACAALRTAKELALQ